MTGLVASPMFLREAELRRGWELLLLGAGALQRAADPVLAEAGLGRAHHRALYYIGRRPGLSVSLLLRLLGVTKQSLGRTLGELDARGLIESGTNDEDRRQRLLKLSVSGRELERRLFEAVAERLRSAYGNAGQEAVSGYWQVLDQLLPLEARGMRAELERGV